jgi:hypothetical protein
MTELATRDTTTVGAFDSTDLKVLQYLGLNPTDPKSRAVVAVARAYGLDPVLKHVIVIPKGGVYITRDGLLHVAHRSGQLDGIVVEQEPALSDDGREWVARVSVYRKDMRFPFTFPGRYPVNGGNRDYAQEMALKAAEAHALRRAFNVTGLGSADERRPEVGTRVSAPVTAAEIRQAAPAHEQPAPADVHDAELVDADAEAAAEVWPEVAQSGGES